MSKLSATFGNADHSDQDLRAALSELLDQNKTCAMASMGEGGVHINTAFFAYAPDLTFYFVSQRANRHSVNVAKNPSVAVAIWTAPDEWGVPVKGVQLFGTCEEVKVGPELLRGMRLYATRFSAFSAMLQNPGEFKTGVTLRSSRCDLRASACSTSRASGTTDSSS